MTPSPVAPSPAPPGPVGLSPTTPTSTSTSTPLGGRQPSPPGTGPSIVNEPPTGPPAVQPPSVPSTGWSPFGATPTAPPTTSGPVGSTRYLPPVPPPSDVVAGNAPVRSGARWGWRALVAFVAGGLIAAAGFGAARVGLSDEAETASAPTSAASPDPTPTPTTVPEIRGTAPAPLGEPPADIEPAAFVAQVLGPAVVKLETGIGLGSGVLYDENLVLTNFHVIEGATNLTVTLSTGRVLPAEIVGTDPSTDVAVVRVETDEALPLAELATGVKPQVGQLAVAIGSPFDLQQSVTQGIVSAVDRPIPNTETSVVAMIQTDAPINPGNSGGALADRFGRVIGINTSIQTDGFTSTNVGVGFAIPIDTAVRIADLLVAGLPIEPGFLGVRGEEPPNGEVGVLLTEITEDSAAESAGLQTGDRVLSLDGAPVSEMLELAGLVLANQAGDTVVLEVVRDGELIEIEAVLGEREADN